MKDKVLEALKDNFRPEFLNRLDEIIVFDVLSPEAIKEIVNLRIKVVMDRLSAKGIGFEISEDALSHLARVGYDPHYGARPLNRLIQTKILNPVASLIISNGAKKGDTEYVSTKPASNATPGDAHPHDSQQRVGQAGGGNELSIEMKKGRTGRVKSTID